jgi:hypothetical protein
MSREDDAARIDWEGLARRLGSLSDDGERGGTDLAQQALEQILGEAEVRAAVDYYVSGRRGFELARSVLGLLRPWSAMQRCYEVFRTDPDPESRRSAVELLRAVADRRALAWVPEFLRDSDEGVQTWGAGVVDQLLWSGLVEEENCQTILEMMSGHPNPGVQRYYCLIRESLDSHRSAE